MNHGDLHIVLEELPLGKCEFSLRTIILLKTDENIKFLNKYFGFICDAVNFYKEYNMQYLTPDGLIYHDIGEHMILAAADGNMEIVKLMLKPFFDKNNMFMFIYDCNQIMFVAAYNGHIEIVKLMLNVGAYDYDQSMCEAAANGHMEIVKLMLEKGARNYKWAIRQAEKYGHTAIVKLLQSKLET